MQPQPFSAAENTDPQNAQLSPDASRDAPQLEQRTTRASWTRGACTSIDPPQRQRTDLPGAMSDTSYCAWQDLHSAKMRMAF